MINVQDEQGFQSAGDFVIELVGFSREAEAHPDEVLDVAQGVIGVEGRLAHRVLVAEGGQGGDLGDEASGGRLDLVGISAGGFL